MNTETAVNKDDPSVMEVELSPSTSIIEAMHSLATALVRINSMRRGLGRPAVLPSKITIQLDSPPVTEEDRKLLQAARLTGFTERVDFGSPEEVRQFFSRETLQLVTTPGSVLQSLTDEQLAAMAEAVIKTRTACQF